MEKIIKTVLCASVKQREEQLKVALASIYDQVDEIHLVLNFYTDVPVWIQQLTKVYTYCNPTNQNAHDAIWFRTLGIEAVDKLKNEQSRYYFAIDDDLLYPANYVSEMVDAIERHKRNAIITAHGANIMRPVKDYFECRSVYGFSDRQERDIFIDMAGVGCSAWHSSTIKPVPDDFPIPFCRDLWFAINAKRNDVPLISLRRPSQWILPLQTEGETIYELTRSNEKLKALKNRIMKEQLLPLIAFPETKHGSPHKWVLMTDYGFDERLVVNSLATLSDVCVSNNVIFTDQTRIYAPGNVLTQFVTEKEHNIGRMGSKVLTQYRFMKGLPDGSQVISADCDLHYLSDPFQAFDIDYFNHMPLTKQDLEGDGMPEDGTDWDIAVTTRPYEYRYPINGGVVFFKINKNVRDLLDYIMAEIYDRTWFELQQYQRKFGHQGNDWYIDQDIWCCCWLYKNLIKERFGVTIIDAGPNYNFCPHADGGRTDEGKAELLEAFRNGSASVLHLKSRLKECLFDGDLS